ncbi:hypothetical protein [uncultured Litoreibacter sp.]|uniref:hypothetical protein n=1 Tax=uncultured Litoreibacter sp. TaxID=1392394 RepID=UPI00263A3B56|nr:hypothetical protein [uncultured Litoreibacter sp.]
MFHIMRPLLLSFGLILVSPTAFADTKPNPVQMHNSNTVWFENWVGLANASLVVASPDGTIERVEARNGTPVYRLSGSAIDGIYQFELRAATDKEDTRKQKNALRIQEDDDAPKLMIPFYRTGFFVVERGVVITPEDVEEEEEG